MAKNMTFNAAIKLRTNEFRKGIRDIQNSLKGLQRTFLGVAGALGAGLGFTQMVSNVKKTAVDLSVAKAVLENVSRETRVYDTEMGKVSVSVSNYGENLQYVRDLSNKYSQDLIALTNSFAQFSAACRGTNISLDQQKDIFESLTRAAAYYHMSAPQVEDMQRAIVQMASKGRVAAEELRRQLGNSLPGAFNLMAAALGMTTAQLDDAMRKGKILAEDALPKFAAMLNTVTKDINLDSLQLSINRLKNSWTEMINSADFESGLNRIVKAATKVLNFFQTDFWPKVLGLGVGIGSAIAGPRGFKSYLTKLKRETELMQQEYDKQVKITESYQKKLDKVAWLSRSGEDKTYTFNGAKYEEQETKVRDRYGNGAPQYLAWKKQQQEAARTLRVYNSELEKTERLHQKTFKGNTTYVSKEDVKNLEAAGRQMSNIAELAKKPAPEINKSAAATRVLLGLWKTVKSLFATAVSSLAVGAIIGLLTALVSKLISVGQEWKRVKNIVKDYQEEVARSERTVSENEKLLRSYLKIVQDTSKSERTRIQALKEINKLMGSNYTTDALDKTKQAYKDIVKEVNRWIEATKLQAKIQVQATKAASAESEIERLRAENTRLNAEATKYEQKHDNALKSFGGMFEAGIYGTKASNIRTQMSQNVEAIRQLGDVAKLANEALDSLGVSLANIESDANNGGGGGGNGKPQGIEKVYEEWKEEYAKLRNQLKEGAISKKKYDEELDKLITKTWGEASATGKLSIKDILNKQSAGKTLSAMEEWYIMLSNEAKDAVYRALERGTDDIIKKLGEELQKDIDKEIEDIFDEEGKNIQERLDALKNLEMPQLKAPDTWDNYKQTDAEIWAENADAAEDYLHQLEDLAEELMKLGPEGETALANLSDSMTHLAENARDLRTKARIEEWKEDIKELKEQFGSDLYGGIKNVAQGFERLYDTFKDLSDKFEDAEGFEKVILAFETLFEVLETGMAVYEGIKKASETLQLLKKAEGNEEMKSMEKQLAMRTAMAGAAATEAGAVTAAEAAKTSAIELTAKALKNAGVAGAVASAMELPYPANLAALASNMAALTAALSAGQALQAFADGGIVKGPASGDKTLIRANGGEMMLNKSQQNDLWNFIKNGSQGMGGGKVEFEIRGDKLWGTLQNYNNKRRG